MFLSLDENVLKKFSDVWYGLVKTEDVGLSVFLKCFDDAIKECELVTNNRGYSHSEMLTLKEGFMAAQSIILSLNGRTVV